MANVQGSGALFDLTSYARRGPGRQDRLSPSEIALISRTVRRVPEVMVKVLSQGGQDLKAVGRHINYLLDREDGELDFETDDGRPLSGEGATQQLIDDWDLELDAHRNRADLGARPGGSQKLVHKLLFSMPAGAPPEKVLAAVKNLAREEFGLKHRYAMVLHTDEPHPHVHMVLKAVSEQGVRLHIRKQDLRNWRLEFARHLRAVGVEANATSRAIRGQTREARKDGIYRANLRGESTYMRDHMTTAARELTGGIARAEPGKSKLAETRDQIRRGWATVGDILGRAQHLELAAQVRQFSEQMRAPTTEGEAIASDLLERARHPPEAERG